MTASLTTPVNSACYLPQNTLTSFQRDVYQLLMTIPKGKVTTYMTIAISLGDKRKCRAVGQALKVNPFGPHPVPCHRVVKTDGGIGGFHGALPDNIKRKYELLLSEGEDDG